MSIERRAIFPVIMFTLAGASFLFGGWQYLQARSVRIAAQERLAYIITTIEQSPVSRLQKNQIYTTIMNGLPSAPGAFGLDISGSFASRPGGDSCSGDGQRAVCSALYAQNAPVEVISAVCGTCKP